MACGESAERKAKTRRQKKGKELNRKPDRLKSINQQQSCFSIQPFSKALWRPKLHLFNKNRLHTSSFISLQSSSISSALSSSETSPSSAFSSMFGGSFFPWWGNWTPLTTSSNHFPSHETFNLLVSYCNHDAFRHFLMSWVDNQLLCQPTFCHSGLHYLLVFVFLKKKVRQVWPPSSHKCTSYKYFQFGYQIR